MPNLALTKYFNLLSFQNFPSIRICVEIIIIVNVSVVSETMNWNLVHRRTRIVKETLTVELQVANRTSYIYFLKTYTKVNIPLRHKFFK